MRFEICTYQEKDLKKAKAKVDTNFGSFEIQLFLEERPRACWNFINLVEGRQRGIKDHPYYEGLKLYNLSSRLFFFGSPQNRKGTTSGYEIDAELDPKLPMGFPFGVVYPMNGTLRFEGGMICIYKNPEELRHGHTLFGRVIHGFDTLEKIFSFESEFKQSPSSITIEKIQIIRS